MAYRIIVGTTTLPSPAKDGYTVSREAIWTDDTTRNSSGLMTGKILVYKWKLQLKWNALSQEQASLIHHACINANNDGTPNGNTFKTIKFPDPFTGNDITMLGYSGELSFTTYSWVNGRRYLRDVSVDIIEK